MRRQNASLAALAVASLTPRLLLITSKRLGTRLGASRPHGQDVNGRAKNLFVNDAVSIYKKMADNVLSL